MPRSKYTREWYYTQYEADMADARARAEVAKLNATATADHTVVVNRPVVVEVVEYDRLHPVRRISRSEAERATTAAVGLTVATVGLAALSALFEAD